MTLLGIESHAPCIAPPLLFRIPQISVHIGTCCQFPTAPLFRWDFSYSFRMGSLFLRNFLPVQSCISFASATFSVKRTLWAAPADWKCPPLTCTVLAQCSGQVWNYALANKWHPTVLSTKWWSICSSLNVVLTENVSLPWSAPSHYVNQWWFAVNLTLRNRMPWNISRNMDIFIPENAFENVALENVGHFTSASGVKPIISDLFPGHLLVKVQHWLR